MEDPYEVLGVERGASPDEVKSAYREMVKEYHPDRCDREDAEELFKRIKEAYDVVYEEAEASGSKKVGETRGEEKDRSPGKSKDTGDGPRTETVSGSEYEVFGSYGDWNLGRDTQTDEWCVFRVLETAPYANGQEVEYLDGSGSETTERVGFETREGAERAYEKAFGRDATRSRGRGKAERSRRYTRGKRAEGFGTTQEWGETRGEEYLDGLWRLCYQDRVDDDERRWAVTTDGFGSFLDRSGENRRTEFWFGTREDAEDAYAEYVGERRRGATPTGHPSAILRRPKEPPKPVRGRKDNGVAYRGRRGGRPTAGGTRGRKRTPLRNPRAESSPTPLTRPFGLSTTLSRLSQRRSATPRNSSCGFSLSL